ncbi:MAG TPA: CGNR zinc finger domain-containing protein [Acidimicrobiia bacterium]
MGTVPAELWLVESFLNSLDVESGQDDLDSLPRFRRWLGAHGREAAGRRASEDDLALARQVRDVLRDEVRRHHPGVETPAGHHRRLNALAGDIGLRASFTEAGDVVLRPAATGVAGMLGEILATVVTTSTAGTWERLKLCSADDCAYVYFDASKNASRRWCSMAVCGNRSKTRAYRRRLTKPSGAP